MQSGQYPELDQFLQAQGGLSGWNLYTVYLELFMSVSYTHTHPKSTHSSPFPPVPQVLDSTLIPGLRALVDGWCGGPLEFLWGYLDTGPPTLRTEGVAWKG